jgi:hypothetical protein
MASAQSGETETGEVTAFGGVGFGAGTQPVGGGSAGVSFSRYGMALIEASFMPMGKYTIQPWPAQSAVQRSFLYDFALDFHVRIPVKARWEPYAILGSSVLWNQLSASGENRRGDAVVNHYNQVNASFNTGAGVRYFVGKNWGLRPEVKVIISKQIYTRVSMGIFYVTPPDWP